MKKRRTYRVYNPYFGGLRSVKAKTPCAAVCEWLKRYYGIPVKEDELEEFREPSTSMNAIVEDDESQKEFYFRFKTPKAPS